MPAGTEENNEAFWVWTEIWTRTSRIRGAFGRHGRLMLDVVYSLLWRNSHGRRSYLRHQFVAFLSLLTTENIYCYYYHYNYYYYYYWLYHHNHHSHIPEERRPQLYRFESLKSRHKLNLHISHFVLLISMFSVNIWLMPLFKPTHIIRPKLEVT
jgi:Ca2+/Na+ antiporter